ncbi:hypothetical protein PPL_11633 [Heterostelium album PN500]|uniref:Uncharacterized protein n=1 Tax=Heterostelium pallidum (strain ATCC 26659 / Pp 5 / PN500) TaxID=670386 RepID=D3BVA7_HETP5|nr:hypothetical protein PPL_11633 [Heterostelium album PN500]EFA74664.1 hypothetical protein PPL_11633 [Heterostelium album PN500]|eukprot:XP_020426798.1 hypothetical protein PPL_11633 [Heterostelium album PN500]
MTTTLRGVTLTVWTCRTTGSTEPPSSTLHPTSGSVVTDSLDNRCFLLILREEQHCCDAAQPITLKEVVCAINTISFTNSAHSIFINTVTPNCLFQKYPVSSVSVKVFDYVSHDCIERTLAKHVQLIMGPAGSVKVCTSY